MSKRPKALSCVAALLAAGVPIATGCSGSSPARRHTASATVAAQAKREHDGDGDNDSLGMGPLDSDGDASPTWGPAATPGDRQAVAALLRRYYAAAAAGSAAKVCGLFSVAALESVVEEHSHDKGPAWQRGGSCEQIAAKTLRREHRLLATRLAALKVTSVEVRGTRAWATVSFGFADEDLAILRRAPSGWTLTSLGEQAL